MKDFNDEIKKILNEEAYRPADNIDNGQIEPISLSPEDLQAEPPAPVEPYPANLTPVEVQDLDEKDFVRNPANIYEVDPETTNITEEAWVDGVKVSKAGGVEHIVASHNDETDDIANQKYQSSLLSREPNAKVLRVSGSRFVLANDNGDVAQVCTQNGKHYIRFSEMAGVPIEKGHISNVVTQNLKLHESIDLDEDGKQIMESFKANLAKQGLHESTVSGEIQGMLASQGLNEDFTDKAKDLFESAVVVASQKYMTVLESAAEKCIAEEIANYQATLQSQINEYLETVVNEWVEENRVALEQGSRTQIAESFMEQMKAVLESHYVDLPSDKKDLYESTLAEKTTLATKLNEETNKTASLINELNQYKKKAILESQVKGLTAIKAEKVKELAEAIEYVNDKQYTSRVQFVMESIAPKSAKQTSTLTEDSKPNQSAAPSETLHEDVAAVLNHLNAYTK